MNSKGYIYTVVSVILALLLLSVMSLYYDSFKVSSQVSPTKIRTDELHYFVESTQKDLTRAMVITGRRGAIYLADYVISTNTTFSDSQSALKSLTVNGSLRNASGIQENVTYMQNHSLSVWLNGVKSLGDDLGFDVNITFVSVDVYQYDAWNFLEVITLNYNISDNRGSSGPVCRYENPSLRLYSLVSTSGVEDVLYPMNTANKIRRLFTEDTSANENTIITTGLNGSGIGGGVAYDLSPLSDPSDAILAYDENYTSFGQEHPPAKYAVFVLNVTNYNLLSAAARGIINSSAGVINYNNLNLTGRGFPYVSGIAYINFSQNRYVALKSGAENQILRLEAVSDLAAKTYRNTSAGPCFFDRLEGRLNLSEKYVNQSRDARAIFGLEPEENLGIESYANISEFAQYKLYETGYLPGFDEESTVDHAYFKGETGTWIYGTPEWFRLRGADIQEYGFWAFEYAVDREAYWGFDEDSGSDTFGYSTWTEEGSLMGDTSWSEGKSGSAVQFNDSHLEIQNANLNQKEDWTFMAWILPQNKSGYVYSEGIPQATFVLTVDPSGSLTSSSWNAAYPGYWMSAYSDPELSFGDWNHIAVTLSNGGVGTGTISFYINGEPASTAPFQMENNALTAYAAFGDNIGAYYGGGQANAYLNGTIDEVEIYSRALTEDEIRYKYESIDH